MKCPYCGTDGKETVTTRTIKMETGEILVIENAPMISCRECGQVSFSAQTVKQIEEVKSHPENIKEKKVKFATL